MLLPRTTKLLPHIAVGKGSHVSEPNRILTTEEVKHRQCPKIQSVMANQIQIPIRENLQSPSLNLQLSKIKSPPWSNV